MESGTADMLHNHQPAGYMGALEASVGEQARLLSLNRLRLKGRAFVAAQATTQGLLMNAATLRWRLRKNSCNTLA